jgi:hypothetical protein
LRAVILPYRSRNVDTTGRLQWSYAGVKSWSAFERGLQVWDLNESDGIFQIAGNTRGPQGWVEDRDQAINFPPGTSVDSVIDRMIAILQDAPI